MKILHNYFTPYPMSIALIVLLGVNPINLAICSGVTVTALLGSTVTCCSGYGGGGAILRRVDCIGIIIGSDLWCVMVSGLWCVMGIMGADASLICPLLWLVTRLFTRANIFILAEQHKQYTFTPSTSTQMITATLLDPAAI